MENLKILISDQFPNTTQSKTQNNTPPECTKKPLSSTMSMITKNLHPTRWACMISDSSRKLLTKNGNNSATTKIYHLSAASTKTLSDRSTHPYHRQSSPKEHRRLKRSSKAHLWIRSQPSNQLLNKKVCSEPNRNPRRALTISALIVIWTSIGSLMSNLNWETIMTPSNHSGDKIPHSITRAELAKCKLMTGDHQKA